MGQSVQEKAELLPDSVKTKKRDGDVGAADLKDSALTAKLRLTCKLTPQFVKTMQEHYTKLKSDGREETYGEKHTFNTHYLKMNMLHEEGAPDLKAFLDWHATS